MVCVHARPALMRLVLFRRDAACIVSLTRQFSALASGPKTPMAQVQGGLARTESLEMHTMSSSEMKKRHAAPILALFASHRPACLLSCSKPCKMLRSVGVVRSASLYRVATEAGACVSYDGIL